jgi:hypothetical protein
MGGSLLRSIWLVLVAVATGFWLAPNVYGRASCPSENEIRQLCQVSERVLLARYVIRSSETGATLGEFNSCSDGYRALCRGQGQVTSLVAGLGARPGDCSGKSQEACLAAAAQTQQQQAGDIDRLARYQGQVGFAASQVNEMAQNTQRISAADRARADACVSSEGQNRCSETDFEQLRRAGLVREITREDCARNGNRLVCSYLASLPAGTEVRDLEYALRSHSDSEVFNTRDATRLGRFVANHREGTPLPGHITQDNTSNSAALTNVPNNTDAPGVNSPSAGPGGEGTNGSDLLRGLGGRGTYAEPLLAVRPPPGAAGNPFVTTGASSMPEHQRILRQLSEEQKKLEEFSGKVRENSFKESAQNFQKSAGLMKLAKRTEGQRGELGSLNGGPRAGVAEASTPEPSEQSRKKSVSPSSELLSREGSRAGKTGDSFANVSFTKEKAVGGSNILSSKNSADPMDARSEVISAKGKEDKAVKERRGAARRSLEEMLRRLGRSEEEIAKAMKQFDEADLAQGARALASLSNLLDSGNQSKGSEPGFEMLGSETDAVIRGLHGELDSERGILAEDTEDLFTRVRSTYRRSESQGRVSVLLSPKG